MDSLFHVHHYRDARSEYLKNTPREQLNSTINLSRVEGTCRFNTRIDWILLPPTPAMRRDHSPDELTKDNHNDHDHNNSNNSNNNSSSSDESPSVTVPSNHVSITIAPSSDGYQVIDTSHYTDHQLVIADLFISSHN